MNFEHMTLMSWLLLAIFGIICTILGYLWGKSVTNTTNNSGELKTLQDSNAKLRNDLEGCKQKLASQTTKATTPEIKKSPVAVAPEALFNAELAKKSFGKKIKLNDLKVIEGIGPKIEQLFHNFDIKSW